MSTQFSLWVAQEILDHINRKDLWSPPYSVMYLGLATASADLRNNLLTDEASTSGTGYNRIQVGPGSSNVWEQADANGKSFIDGAVVFPEATGAWGTITTAFTVDSLSGTGNVYHIIDLDTAQSISTGETPRFIDTQLWIGL